MHFSTDRSRRVAGAPRRLRGNFRRRLTCVLLECQSRPEEDIPSAVFELLTTSSNLEIFRFA
jgi:hypothetical protein